MGKLTSLLLHGLVQHQVHQLVVALEHTRDCAPHASAQAKEKEQDHRHKRHLAGVTSMAHEGPPAKVEEEKARPQSSREAGKAGTRE